MLLQSCLNDDSMKTESRRPNGSLVVQITSTQPSHFKEWSLPVSGEGVSTSQRQE